MKKIILLILLTMILCVTNLYSEDYFKKKQDEMRSFYYPERIVNLLFRLGNRCDDCLRNMSTHPKIMRVTPSGNQIVKRWSPPSERKARRDLKQERIEAFYIMINDGHKCACNISGDYEALSDYDEDLDINRNGPVLIFEEPNHVGSGANNYGDSFSNHYSRPIKSYPPVIRFERPESPRIRHTTCAECNNENEAYNSFKRQEYGTESDIYITSKDLDLTVRILYGLHNHVRDLNNNASLNETEYFLEYNDLMGRIELWREEYEDNSLHLDDIQKSLIAIQKEIPKLLKEVQDCENSEKCKESKSPFVDPMPSERVACNRLTDEELNNEEAEFFFEDLSMINIFFDKASLKWNECNSKYECPKMDCDVIKPIRDNALALEIRLKETKPWSEKYKSTVFKQWKALSENSIQSQTNLNSAEWAQSLQGGLHNLSSSTTAIWDINRSVKNLAEKPLSSTDMEANRRMREEVIKQLSTLDEYFETAMSAIGLFNNATSDIRFPFVEGKGTPGIRILNKHTVSLGFCIKSVASELNGLIQNVKDKKPGWKGNVLAFAVKTLQCYSILQQMERADIMDNIKRDIAEEEKILKSTYRNYQCLNTRYEKLEEAIKKAEDTNREMVKCVRGPCGPDIYPPHLKHDPPLEGYGKALKIYEAQLWDLAKKLEGAAEKIEITESPPPRVELNKSIYLPSEITKITYEIPWCIQQASWFGIVPDDVTSETRSIDDNRAANLPYFNPQTWLGEFPLKAPQEKGKYDIRLYDNGMNGKELKKVGFTVRDTLENLIDQGKFTKVYQIPLADQFVEPEYYRENLEPGKGRIFFISLAADRRRANNHIIISQGERNVYAGWDFYRDLSPGDYTVTFDDYVIDIVSDVSIYPNSYKVITVGQDNGRLSFIQYDAVGNSIGGHVEVRHGATQKVIYTGWDTYLDLPPDKYDVKFTDYIPDIEHKGVIVEKKQNTTVVSSGYARVTVKALDALGVEVGSHIDITRKNDGAHIYAGWDKIIDLPPDTYNISFSDYTPDIVVDGVQLTAGLETPITVGGYGRVTFKPFDALGNPIGSHLIIASQSDNKDIYAGWNLVMDIPPGLYTVTFTEYIPDIVLKDLEVYKGKNRTVKVGDYGRGRLIINSPNTEYHAQIHDLNDKLFYSGWAKFVDLPVGTYKVTYSVFEPDWIVKITVIAGQSVSSVPY